MTKPTSSLRLRGKQINDNEYSCLGEQLRILLLELQQHTTDSAWFVADLDAFGPELPEELRNTGTPVAIGGTQEVIALADQIPQFLSGVFLAIPKSATPFAEELLFDTEDAPFRDIGEALLEIRTFDTSYFELYARDPWVLEHVAKRFHGTIEHAEQQNSI